MKPISKVLSGYEVRMNVLRRVIFASFVFLMGPAFAQTMDGGVAVPQGSNVHVNPVLKECLLPDTPCSLPPAGQVGHSFRMFLPGATSQESTGFYDRNMVWLAKLSNTPPATARFKVETFFAPNCTPPSGQTMCVANSFKFFYQISAVNQPQGERIIAPKNNFSAPKIVGRKEILENSSDPLASIMLTGGAHSFADCLGLGSGSCIIGSSSGGEPVCLNTANTAAMQAYSGSSYCAPQGGCPTGWTDVSNKDGNNLCGSGPCCQ